MQQLIKTLMFFVCLMSGLYANAETPLSKQALYSIFDQVNGFDIETATLGVIHSDNKAVRQLAAMVLRDHSMVIQMARSTAKQENITYKVDNANASAISHQKTLQSLRRLSGKAFDKAYLRHEIEFHTSAIKAVKTVLMPAAKGTELETLLLAVLPGFEHHLQQTKKLAASIGAEGVTPN